MQLWLGTNDPAMDVLAWPAVDISGVNSSPPLVDCGQHPQLGGRIYLAAHHVVDAVKVIAGELSQADRDAIARNVGALPVAEADELFGTVLALEGELKRIKANIGEQLADEVVERLAQVIDLDAERAKRRPEPVAAKPAS